MLLVGIRFQQVLISQLKVDPHYLDSLKKVNDEQPDDLRQTLENFTVCLQEALQQALTIDLPLFCRHVMTFTMIITVDHKIENFNIT